MIVHNTIKDKAMSKKNNLGVLKYSLHLRNGSVMMESKQNKPIPQKFKSLKCIIILIRQKHSP